MSSTDTADEIVEIGLSPPKKRAKKRHFDASTKEMILNIYKCEVNEKPGSTVNDVAIKVANKSGVYNQIVNNNLSLTDEISKLNKIYMNLCNAVDDLNDCCGLYIAVKQASLLVCEGLCSSIEGQSRIQLSNFYEQLLLRKMEFSACGFGNVDRTLITTISATATLYLVAAVQFEISED
ncbi:hypothetical protein ILUMI_11997 [Ignelater luminosus]|uniref:Uncharacterized protein n=1 Tax=Ignelater luminosus TaxID=2038154 RepID=A0A8K0CV69_IGNLU|nr:hypothetical protein ILUMI_11997 [Ignelater luminosus]